MEPDHKVLSGEEWDRAHRVVSAWKNDPAAQLACPRCNAEGLGVEDQSVRPYAEWFQLDCDKCNLEVSVHLPQAPPAQTPV
jgi:hypothetical protein